MTYLIYDETSPTLLRWAVSTNRAIKVGDPAGCLQRDHDIYHLVKVNGKLTRIHRVVWELHNGKIPDGYVIDHIDQNKHNNKISNLRCVPKAYNAYNSNKRKGILVTSAGKYRVRIRISGKLLNLGTFDTVEEETAVYNTKRLELLNETPFCN